MQKLTTLPTTDYTRVVACSAIKKDRQKGKSPWAGADKSSNASSGSQAAAKLSDAAKAAAKRATRFAKQRQERAYSLAREQQDIDDATSYFNSSQQRSKQQTSSDLTEYRRNTRPSAAAAAAADNAAAEDYQDLRPYVEVVLEHMDQRASEPSSQGRGRGARKEAARTLLEAHTGIFQAALDLELQQEWQEAEERLKSWPQSRLSAEGVALFGLAASPDGAVARDVVLRFFVPEQPLPFHSFSQGDILLVSQGDPLGDSHEAVVVDFSSRWIRLAMNPTAAAAVAAASGGGWFGGSSSGNGSSGGPGRGSSGSSGGGGPGRGSSSSCSRRWRSIWRLDLFANTVSHERCSEALQRFAAAASLLPGSSSAERVQQGLVSGLLTQGQLQQQEVLCRVLAGVLPKGIYYEAACRQTPPWANTPNGQKLLRQAKADVKALVEDGSGMNRSQGAAIIEALTRTVTLWQGPPGTGKTTTLLEYCGFALSLLPPGEQLLAVAASNVAVDQLVTGLLSRGIEVVRIGQPVKVTPELRSVTLEALAANTAPGQAAAKLRKQLVDAATANRASNSFNSSSSSSTANGRGRQGRGGRGSSSSSGRGGRGGGGESQGSMWQQLVALEAAAAAEVLDSVQVVAATCVGAGDPVLQHRYFTQCILDEATQAPEPAALVAVAQKAQSLVMVGDPRQLPPTVTSREAQRLGLGYSLFERVQAMGATTCLLDTQYRMHPKLAEFPSTKFYKGLLQSWPRPVDRPLPEGLQWPNPQVPVMFIQCAGPETRTAASFSVSRKTEAALNSDEDNINDSSSSSSSSSSSRSSGHNPRSSSSSSSSNGGSSGGGYSYSNAAEVRVVVDCLQQLLGAGMLPQDLCVITPYSGQVRAIQRVLSADSGQPGGQQQQRKLRAAGAAREDADSSEAPTQTTSRSGPGRRSSAAEAAAAEGPVGVEVKSVDGFQGREKEVVIFSAVRSNPAGRVGFLADARRLNVVLTRAKRGLVVVGDARTLRNDPVWSSWLSWAKKHGAVVGQPSSRVSEAVS